MGQKTYVDPDQFCDHCDADTAHVVHESGHERDSSGDWKVCLTCGLRTSGYSSYASHVDDEYLEILQRTYLKWKK